VERAFQQVARHLAAVAHVRAQVLAIGIDHPHLPVLAAPHGQIAREIAGRLDLAHGQVLRQHERVPAEREPDIEIARLRAGAVGDRRDAPGLALFLGHLFKDLPDRDRRSAGIGGGFGHVILPGNPVLVVVVWAIRA